MDINRVLKDIGGRTASGRSVPEDLRPFSCFVPDGGYCIMCVPEVFTDEGEAEPENYCIPLPERYVIEKGYRFLGSGIPCVEVRYDPMLGAIVDEEYESWR